MPGTSGRTQKLSISKSHRTVTVCERFTASEIISEAGSDEDHYLRFRAWGRHADEADLAVVLQHLWESRDPNISSNLLKVFSNRALPTFDIRLIDLCQHGDSEVRRCALNALQNNEHASNSRVWAFSTREGNA